MSRRSVTYEKKIRDLVKENGNVLVTVDVDARHIGSGGVCVQLQLTPEKSKAVYAYAVRLAAENWN